MMPRKPVRIQRKRSKGWRMPEGAVYVGRGTIFGNSTRIDEYWSVGFSGTDRDARKWAVDQYRWRLIENNWMWGESMRQQVRQDLRGKDLACWCPLDQPCHADVLLELANVGTS